MATTKNATANNISELLAVTPSLRKFFAHDAIHWQEFQSFASRTSDITLAKMCKVCDNLYKLALFGVAFSQVTVSPGAT